MYPIDLPPVLAPLGLLLLWRHRRNKWAWLSVPVVMLYAGWGHRLTPHDPLMVPALLAFPCVAVGGWINRREKARVNRPRKPGGPALVVARRLSPLTPGLVHLNRQGD